jgi:hypothetical protein
MLYVKGPTRFTNTIREQLISAEPAHALRPTIAAPSLAIVGDDAVKLRSVSGTTWQSRSGSTRRGRVPAVVEGPPRTPLETPGAGVAHLAIARSPTASPADAWPKWSAVDQRNPVRNRQVAPCGSERRGRSWPLTMASRGWRSIRRSKRRSSSSPEDASHEVSDLTVAIGESIAEATPRRH